MKPKLKRYLSKVGDLPSIPTVANNVMRITEDPTSSVDDLRNVIEQDPAITARILKVANSSLYSFSREIKTLSHAITLLGFRTVKNLVLAASLRQTFQHFGALEKGLWEHSTVSAAVASRLATRPGLDIDREEAFTAGLLHDLGQVALVNSSRESFMKVAAQVEEQGLSFAAAEREEFGFDHTELGACVARKWKLPESLEAAIAHHHSPEALAALTEPLRKLTALTAVTTACCERLGIGRAKPREDLDLASLPEWQTLGFTEDDLDEILQMVAEQVEQLGGLFG